MVIVGSRDFVEGFQPFRENAGEVIDLSRSPKGLRLTSQTGPSQIETILPGQVMGDLPGSISVTTQSLWFAARVLKLFPTSQWIAIDIHDLRIDFLPLGEASFLVSVPTLDADTMDMEAPIFDNPSVQVRIVGNYEKRLTQMLYRPSGRDVERALVQLHVESDHLAVVAFYGRTLSEFRMEAEATGSIQVEFPIHTFSQLVRVGFFAPGSLAITPGNRLIRFERHATIQIAPLVEQINLTGPLANLEVALENNRAVVSRAELLEVATAVATSPDHKLAISLDSTGGYAEMLNAEKQIVEREITGKLLTSQPRWTIGRTLNAHRSGIEQSMSFITRAQDVVNALRVLADSTHIHIATPGPQPAFFVVKDVVTPFPRIMISTAVELGGGKSDESR